MWHHLPSPELEINWLRSVFACRDDPGPPALIPPAGLLRQRFRAWFAPIGQMEGCWLDGVVSMANAHTELGAKLVRLQVALEEVAAKRRSKYESFPAEVPAALRAEVAWLTALSRWGAAFVPEMVGFTLAHARLEGGLFRFTSPDPCDHSTAQEAATACLPHLDPDRLAAGIAGYHRCSHTWLAAWEAIAADPRRQVLALLRQKARYGLGYHARIQLAGKPLDEWLAELEKGAGEAFLDAFLSSPLKERFLSQTLAFGGPMFGVFSLDEQALLRSWLEWEQTANPHRTPTAAASWPIPPLPAPAKPGRAERLSPPRLYHQLLYPERFPACLPAARAWVEKILARTSKKVPFAYTPAAFRRWVGDLHTCQAQVDSVPTAPALSKAAYLFGIEQLAPTILVDGSWLAKTLLLVRRDPMVGQPLWQIFRDEVGDGEPSRNHANIYRRLLDQTGIALPPFDSEEFIRYPRFLPFAFDLPAFLLAIGQFPEEFLPELLGLNLAIELSGLGRVYQRLALDLEFYGLDATIVRLHQAIDNLASGHAALARDAILAYLQRMAVGGKATVQQQWQRIWRGYRALAVAARRFALALTIAWGWRFAHVEHLSWSMMPWFKR